MGESKASTLLLIIVFILDVIAFGLAVAAEQRRSTAKVVPDPNSEYTYCVYDSDIATGYGVGAFLFLFVSQALIMGATRCLCCGRSLRPGGSRASAIVLFIATWLTFIIAEACFVGGAARNAYHTKYRGFYQVTNLSCETLRKGVFAAGASFTVFTLILSELYYVSFARSKEGGWTPYGRESAIGMSSFP
uniref:Fiber protein Fb34 n=1 Tax=Picea sitchensis TaxID=3332 RepID=A9NNH9_PICSI|nr:unknown [Picea sitchensis]ACN40434.1 unknown [Picea sitchensis]